ncbi:MAG: hypothetical protein LLG13_05660 [Bacteroidales bacterium]|nr:hypothetical protein [Bacteroidales bacterium]
MRNKSIIIFLILWNIYHLLNAQIPYPGNTPGKATIKYTENCTVLENNVVSMRFESNSEGIHIREFKDKESNELIKMGNIPLFEIELQGHRAISSNDFVLENLPVIQDVKGDVGSQVYACRESGKKYSVDLENRKEGLFLHWEVEIRDGSNYVRQIFKFKANNKNKISGIIVLMLPTSIGICNTGTVYGSPVVHNNMFFSLEHIFAKVVEKDSYTAFNLPEFIPTISTVWGVAPANQLRRAFLYYVERERAHPYRQILHNNTWFDIAWEDRIFNENESIDRIRCFGDSLINKRKIQMEAFLFDDGWDDHTTLWKFHSGFPVGFANLMKVAKSYNSTIGVWISPFGGYNTAKQQRLKYGKTQNPPFETNSSGFSLAGTCYYKRILDVTESFIKKYNVSIFKFDGLGAGLGSMGDESVEYKDDVEAFLRLQKELRTNKPDLYLSLTVGTWPSVYWLMYGDNIWRGGEDTKMIGKGSKRQQWITYRDAETYNNIVKNNPLFPLNSVMNGGICIADHGNPGKFEMDEKDISDDIWFFFASGCNLQELYINPHKLKSSTWDCLANAARWARENEQVLTDVHWIGGDPAKDEVYGRAAWSQQKAILSLRNPSDIPKTFQVITSKVFEYPRNAIKEYVFFNAKAGMYNGKRQRFAKGESFSLKLQPFETIVLDAFPVN